MTLFLVNGRGGESFVGDGAGRPRGVGSGRREEARRLSPLGAPRRTQEEGRKAGAASECTFQVGAGLGRHSLCPGGIIPPAAGPSDRAGRVTNSRGPGCRTGAWKSGSAVRRERPCTRGQRTRGTRPIDNLTALLDNGGPPRGQWTRHKSLWMELTSLLALAGLLGGAMPAAARASWIESSREVCSCPRPTST